MDKEIVHKIKEINQLLYQAIESSDFLKIDDLLDEKDQIKKNIKFIEEDGEFLKQWIKDNKKIDQLLIEKQSDIKGYLLRQNKKREIYKKYQKF